MQGCYRWNASLCQLLNFLTHMFILLLEGTDYNMLSYHQGCISRINYPSNKLSFIRRVLNKSRTNNSFGQRLVAVSCLIFRSFHSLFCPIWLMCKTLFKHVVDNNHVCHLIQYWSTAISRKSNNLNRRQLSKSWQHKVKVADNAGQFIKTISLLYSWNKNILTMIYEF